MAWSDDEQPQPAPRRAGSPTKWWEAPQPYEAPPPPWVQDAQTFKRRRPRPDARQDASAALRKWVDYCTTQLRTSALHLRCDIHHQAVHLSATWQRWRLAVADAKARSRRVLSLLVSSQAREDPLPTAASRPEPLPRRACV